MRVPTRLETPRLVLRRHEPDDLDAFICFMGDDDATRYMAFTPEHRTAEGARAMLQYVMASYTSDTPVCSLTIADPHTNAYIGSCGCLPDSTGAFEIYFTVVTKHQKQGYATEAG